MAKPVQSQAAKPLGSRFKTDRPPGINPATVEVAIERIVPGGAGLGHAEGLTLFVSDAAPGDRALVTIDRVQGRTGFATIAELVESSPLRVGGVDPHQGWCGGCDFQHLTYEAQLAAKVEIIRDCLRRIAGIEPPAEIPILPSPRQWGYRARAEWQYDGDARQIGWYERGTHRICEGTECAVLRSELQDLLDDLRERMKAGELPRGRSEIRAVVGDEGTTLVPPLTGEPERVLSVTVAGERYHFDASCFFQANLDVLPALVAEALRFADADTDTADSSDIQTEAGEELERRAAIDLYCGVGLFSLPLAHRFDRVYAVDSYSRAIQYARQNVAEANLTNVKLAALPVDRWLTERARGIGRIVLAVVDPPRTGLDPVSLQGLIRLRPARMTYVSCDPATLARDLKVMLGQEYSLEAVAAIDMFPQTHHVEIVAHLRSVAPPRRRMRRPNQRPSRETPSPDAADQTTG